MISGITIWNPNPELINLFGVISVRYYGILFIAGMVLGYIVARWLFIRMNCLPQQQIEILALMIFVGTILGARLGHCLIYEPEHYLLNPLEILIPYRQVAIDTYQFVGFQGLASHGAAIGVIGATLIFCLWKGANFWSISDILAVAAPIPCSFIRVGNFMNSEIIGKPTNGSWGLVFQSVDSLPRHPAQLYEASAYLVVFILLLYTHIKFKNLSAKGITFGLFLVLMMVSRFILEFFKENQVAFESTMVLNMGQLLSIPFIVLGVSIILWRALGHRYKRSQ